MGVEVMSNYIRRLFMLIVSSFCHFLVDRDQMVDKFLKGKFRNFILHHKIELMKFKTLTFLA